MKVILKNKRLISFYPDDANIENAYPYNEFEIAIMTDSDFNSLMFPDKKNIYTAEINLTQAQKMNAIRQRRNYLLNQSDWTQVPDVALDEQTKAKYQTYRQELRDFPDVVDLNNIVFPVVEQ